jgi:hypothetical protein
MDVKNDILWRVYLSYLLVVVVALAVLGKAVYIHKGKEPASDEWDEMRQLAKEKFL